MPKRKHSSFSLSQELPVHVHVWWMSHEKTKIVSWSVYWSFGSSMGSTKKTKEAPADGRPHACWQRGRSRNIGPTTAAMPGHGTDTDMGAVAKMDTTAAINTATTAGKGTGVSPTWRPTLLMSKQLSPTSRPLWRRSAPTPSVEVRWGKSEDRKWCCVSATFNASVVCWFLQTA